MCQNGEKERTTNKWDFFSIFSSFTYIHILWGIAVAQYGDRQCLKRLQLRKGCVKPFHSRKFPLVCEGTLPKGKDHCPGLPEWLHLLSLLPPQPPPTTYIVAGTKVFYLCFLLLYAGWELNPLGGALDWFSLYLPYLRGKGAQTCQANCPNCMSCLPYNRNEWIGRVFGGVACPESPNDSKFLLTRGRKFANNRKKTARIE